MKKKSNNSKKLIISSPLETKHTATVTQAEITDDLFQDQTGIDNVEFEKSTENIVLIAKYSFEAQSESELTIEEGEPLKLISKKGIANGWIYVQPISRVSDPGFIPKNYVFQMDFNPERSTSVSAMKQNYTTAPYPAIIKPNSYSTISSTSSNSGSASEKDNNKSSVSSFSSTNSVFSTYNTSSSSPNTSSPATLSELQSAEKQGSAKNQIAENPSETLSFYNSSMTAPNKTFKNSIQTKLNSAPEFLPMNIQQTVPTLSKKQSETPSTSLSKGNTLEKVSESNYTNLVIASVGNSNGRFWYRIDYQMVQSASRVYLCRFYQDFYALQLNLLKELKDLHDTNPETQSIKLPQLPNPISVNSFDKNNKNTSIKKSDGRCDELSVYINSVNILCTKCQSLSVVFKDFLKPSVTDMTLQNNKILSSREIDEIIKPKTSEAESSVADKPQHSQSSKNLLNSLEKQNLTHEQYQQFNPYHNFFNDKVKRNDDTHKNHLPPINTFQSTPRSADYSPAMKHDQFPQSPREFPRANFQPQQQIKHHQKHQYSSTTPPLPAPSAVFGNKMYSPLQQHKSSSPTLGQKFNKLSIDDKINSMDKTNSARAEITDSPTVPLFFNSPLNSPSSTCSPTFMNAFEISKSSTSSLSTTTSSCTPTQTNVSENTISKSTSNSSTIKFKIIYNEDIIVLKLNSDVTLTYLKFCISNEINIFDFQLSCKDLRSGLFAPLRTGKELQKVIDEQTTFNKGKISIKVQAF
ncbi:hypothetical protein BVG19_g1363 [[Candida] boidinii]|nr:hypothetical protein BVG19_g1363 [[Candida] boidinii]OWB49012.1 hypothetical protein B5S27_g551 [[Candida] boidinii]